MSKTAYIGGLGCVSRLALTILLVGGLAAVWFWSQGAEPRQAVQDGVVLGTQLATLPCLICAGLSALFLVVGVGMAVLGQLNTHARRR